MLKDKSRILLLGGLLLLVLALMNGGIHVHGFHLFHGSWLKWILFGALIWLLMSRGGCMRSCCGASADSEEEAEDENESDDEE